MEQTLRDSDRSFGGRSRRSLLGESSFRSGTGASAFSVLFQKRVLPVRVKAFRRVCVVLSVLRTYRKECCDGILKFFSRETGASGAGCSDNSVSRNK